MTNKNKKTIQNFRHLVNYPILTIEQTVFKIIAELKLDKEVAINHFLSRLNFYLSITEQNLSFVDFNNKIKMSTMFSEFYYFLFGENNYFNDSDSNRIRYSKAFKALEKFWKININKTGNFDFSKINQEKLEFFKGWFIFNSKNSVFIDFINFYNVFGKEITNKYFKKIELFVLSKGVKTFSNNRALVCTMLNFLANKKELSLIHNDIVYIMKEYFLSHQEKGHDINGKKQKWNWFIELCHSLFNLNNHEQYILSKTQNTNTHIITKNGNTYKTKLITEIPLEIYDNEAFDILFKKLNQDVNLIEDWADYTINYHYQKFLTVHEDFKVKENYYNKSVTDIAILKFGKYDRITQSHLYDKDAYFNRNVLFAIAVKLVLNHPEITDSFISNFIYIDDKNNVVGIRKTDQGTYLIGYKPRKGKILAEQKILLNQETSKLISILLEMTEDIRKNLKDNNNDLYKKLFISCSVNNLTITDFLNPSFLPNKEPFNNIINYLQEQKNISYDDNVNFARNVSLTKIRASRGVKVYFETQSTTKMAKALGHRKYDPQLLSRYLPAPILEFFQRRWILLFQKGIICEAMKDSEFLLKASNFKDMEQLNTFLENHTLKNIPNNSNNKKDKIQSDDDLKIYISVDEEKIAALLSIGKAVEESKDINKVSSKAIYWKQLGEEIVKEINNNHSYAQYKIIVKNAKNKIQANLFDKVIYE